MSLIPENIRVLIKDKCEQFIKNDFDELLEYVEVIESLNSNSNFFQKELKEITVVDSIDNKINNVSIPTAIAVLREWNDNMYYLVKTTLNNKSNNFEIRKKVDESDEDYASRLALVLKSYDKIFTKEKEEKASLLIRLEKLKFQEKEIEEKLKTFIF